MIFDAQYFFGVAGRERSCKRQTLLRPDRRHAYPFCIQGVDNPGYSGCSFSSLQACQASASGTEAECITNPWYSAASSGASAPSGNPPGLNAPIAIGPPPGN